MKKRIIAIITMSIMVLSLITYSLASTNFTDLSGHWAETNVKNLSDKGIIEGYEDGTFKPEGTVTYSEFIKMLVIATTGENPGVSKDGMHWASNYYNAAIDNGLLKKEDIPEKYLDNKIPRADMAYLAANAINETLNKEKVELIQEYITDIDTAGNRKDEVILAYGTGILAGYPNGKFKPSGVLTRAESAAVISRIINPDLRLTIDFEKPIKDKMPELTKDTVLKEYMLQIPDSAKKPIDDIAANLYKAAKETVKYYVIADNNPYNFYISYSLLEDEDISIDEKVAKNSGLVLIKDNKIIYNTDHIDSKGIRTYYILDYDEQKLPDFDYLGFYKIYDQKTDTMILIKNPFK